MADHLPNYPEDPLDEKQMSEFVMLCLEEREQNYKKYSDKIGASCAEGSKTPVKVQKSVIDRIKEVIKAKPQKHSAKQKFFALKLLNKIVMKKNMELNNYVEAKIMSRLTILAEFNNNPEEKSAQLLLSRGKNIFGPEEKDHQNSANFLIILLDCIEKWALTFQFEEGEVDDAVSSSTRSKAQTGDKFYRCYTKLLEKGVKFPSTFQGKERQVKKEKRSADQDEGPPQAQAQPRPSSYSVHQVPDDAQSQSTTFGISPEKKERIGQLKKKMQKVKEMSKQAKKFLDKSAQKKGGDEIVDVAEVLQQQAIFEENKKLGESAISELMSDEIQPHISNSDQLAEKLFGYQDLFEKALQVIEKQIEEQRKIEADVMGRGPPRQEAPVPERKNSFNSDENAHVGDEMPGHENKVAVSSASMGGRISHNMGQQPLRSSMMTNMTAASEVQFEFAMPQNKNPPQDFQANDFKSNVNENPYDFGDFNNKAMFSTHQQFNQGFDDFNFDMPPKHNTAAKAKPNFEDKNDFGFDFGEPDANAQPIKSQMFKEKAPVQPEEENAVIQPKTKKLTMKNQMPSNMGAGNVGQAKVGEENYCSNDFNEQVDARHLQDGDDNEFEGRKSVNLSLKNKNNISEFKSRNSQINERHSRLSVTGSKQNAFEQPANNDFDFNFGGDAPESAQKPAAQNQGFDFQFDQQPPPVKQQANDGFQFDEQPAPPKKEDKQGFDEFDFGTHQESAISAPSKEDFFSYAEPGAQAPRSQQLNQGFNDFNFDNYDENQYAQDQRQQEKGNDFNDQQIPQQSHSYDNQIDSSSYPKNDNYGYGDDYYQEKPQEVSNFDQHDQQKAPENSSSLKLSPNKELFDYAEEMAARRTTTQQHKSTFQVEMPAGGNDDSESIASLQSDDIPAKLKNEKDLEIEKEIKKLREYIKDERITRWWQGQQGQASDDLKSSLQQNYGLHQKSLMTKISQQIEQVESYKTQIYSFEQENRILNEKYQQMVNNQSEDARRVSELEFEVDSFNAQISMIRQQCEKELRNKDDEVQEMKRAVEAMKQEVEAAQKRCEHVNMVEENHKAALLQKDQEIESIRQQLQEAQLDNQLRQQKISNFDIDKQDYEKQIRNLQEQLAEEISRSEASQANDIAVADIKETMQQQFDQKEKAMQAKIAELEAQLSMAMSAEIKSQMQKETKVVEEKPADQFNFNMPPPQQDKPVEQQLGLKQQQDSASSGNQSLPQRASLPQGQRSANNVSQLDFANPGVGAQSMVIQPTEAKLSDRDRGSAMAFTHQDQKSSAAGSKVSESTQAFGASVQSTATGPGSASQAAQPNPAFSFDMFGVQSSSPAKQEQSTTPRTMGAQRVSPKSLMQAQPAPGQQQTFGQRQGTQVYQTNPAQQNAQAAGTMDQRRFTTAQGNPAMQTNPGMMKPQLQTNMSQKSLGPAGQSAGLQTPPSGSMQGQFQQNFQQELLKQKLQSFHLNSLIQGDKCVIYEDVNVKIGLVRQYAAPQGPNGEIKCLFKVFFRNHNQQQIPMHGVHMQFQISEHGPQQQLIRIQRTSRPLPIRVPNTPPLKHNETVELDCDMSIRPVANPNVLPNQSTSVQGIKALKFASIVLNLQYELNNGKKSGLLPIFIPINILNFIAPCKSLNKYEYQGVWNKVVNTPQNQRPGNAACLQTMFTLDKQKVANMQRLMQAMTYCFHHVLEVDPQPNQLSFAAQLKDICLADPNQDRAWILVKMELTKDGGNCKLQCISVKDNLQVALPVFESVLALVSKQA